MEKGNSTQSFSKLLNDRPANYGGFLPTHRTTTVNQNNNNQIFLFLKQANIRAVQTGIQIPIHTAWIISRCIIPVIGKLDTFTLAC